MKSLLIIVALILWLPVSAQQKPKDLEFEDLEIKDLVIQKGNKSVYYGASQTKVEKVFGKPDSSSIVQSEMDLLI